MASNPPPQEPKDKTLNVWSKPIDQNATTSAPPTISDAVSMIKPEDFTKIAETPCARNGFLMGIASGFGVGGLRFILTGNVAKSTNWAAGFFIAGSMASYEYCQYLRRCEKREMKRHIEVINEGRREHAKKQFEAQREAQKLEDERKISEKRWYKFW